MAPIISTPGKLAPTLPSMGTSIGCPDTLARSPAKLEYTQFGDPREKQCLEQEQAPCGFDRLPDELLETVLLQLPGRDLIKVGPFVCKRWHRIINQKIFWKQRCRRDRLCLSPALRITNYMEYYFRRPYDRNLLHNANAEKGMQQWRLLTDGNGGGVVAERLGSGSYPRQQRTDEGYCWATSTGVNCMYQVRISSISVPPPPALIYPG